MASQTQPASQQFPPPIAGAKTKGGKMMMKRFRERHPDALGAITKPAIKRLARRGGVKRISSGIYDEARNALKTFLESIIKDSAIYAAHSKRKTIFVMDVIYALKRQNRTLYGFGG